ncbi:prepilin-type N-terminal cleavage/methylation domain-containing protein, partial [Hydrogenimonas sp.]
MGWRTGNGSGEPGSIQNTTHCVKRGFTLVELLIVLLLMGIVYAIVFNRSLPVSGKPETFPLSLATIDRFFQARPEYRQKSMTLYGTKSGTALLVEEGKIVERLELSKEAEEYRLNPDETLQSRDFRAMKIDGEEFVPRYALR